MIAYQYDALGYYVGSREDFGLLPNNATYEAPEHKEGFIPKWNKENVTWEHIENHKGKKGYVNGEPFTMNTYGELPEGFSETAPEPTEEEQYYKEKERIDAKYSDEKSGVLSNLKNAIIATLCEPNHDNKKLEELRKTYQLECTNMQNELDALDTKYNVA